MQVPTRPEDLDDAFFSAALVEASGHRPIARLSLSPLAEQGRASRTYRAELGSSPASHCPRSVIVKLSLADPRFLARRQRLGTHRLEVDFYRLLAPRLGTLVPACYLARADDETGHFVLVLEDLAPACAAGDDAEEALGVATRLLARVHASYWQDERVAEVLRPCVLAGMFDQRKVGPTEKKIAEDLLARRSADGRLPEVVVAAVQAELRNHDRLAERLHSRPLTCCHGDAHLPQFLFPSPAGGRTTLIDWQTPHFASATMDLRSLLLTSGLSHRRRQSLQPDLLASYHQELVAAGVEDYDRDELEYDHKLMLHHRLMMALVLPHEDTPEELEVSYGSARDHCLVSGEAEEVCWLDRAPAIETKAPPNDAPCPPKNPPIISKRESSSIVMPPSIPKPVWPPENKKLEAPSKIMRISFVRPPLISRAEES